MNKIRVIALVLSTVTAVAPLAGAQAPRGQQAEAGVARAERGGLRRGIMRGMKLSAGEKAKVRMVHEKYAAESKPARESLRAAMQEARADRQKGDTAAARAVFERTKSNRESLRVGMGKERNEMRAALTPANQKQFDANMKQAVAARGKKGKGSSGRRAKASNG